MNEVWRSLRDPRVSTSLVLAAVVLLGFGLLASAYRSTAGLGRVAAQVPYLVSGAVVGLALVGAGLALLTVHLERADAAQERRASAVLQRDVLRMLAKVSQARDDAR